MSAPVTNGQRMIRQTLTIARRDFVATVFAPMFLVFLLSPMIMIGFGAGGGFAAQSMASGSADKERIVVIAPSSDAPLLLATDHRLRDLFSGDGMPATVMVSSPSGDAAAQARAAFDDKDHDVSAVLYGPLATPTILYSAQGGRDSRYLAELAESTLRSAKSGGATPLSVATRTPFVRGKASIGGHQQSAFFGVLAIFFLTLFLSGQAVGTMAEERSNKVIEVLAAAVPLESVFLGKLIGMFCVAIVFVAFWGTLFASAGRLIPPDMARAFAEVGPAIGFPTFMLLFFSYFTTAYMLLGAVFLGVGAQAQTMREIQMLSLPITILQMAMFGLSAAAASHPGTPLALFAEIFPLSSPFAMVALAANSPTLWPHLLALVWQILWVALVIFIGAGAFRRGVLQSGGTKLSLKALFARG